MTKDSSPIFYGDLQQLAYCRQRINKIMSGSYPHVGISQWTELSNKVKCESVYRLNLVLSGKESPFDGALEYLQSIKAGRA